MFSDKLGVRHGTREGARAAVVASFGTDTSCTRTALTPTPSNSQSARLVCLTKDRVGLDDDRLRVKVVLHATDGYTAGSPLLVCVQYRPYSISGFFGGLLTDSVVTTEVQMRIEEVHETEPLQAAQESPLPGETWAGCTL